MELAAMVFFIVIIISATILSYKQNKDVNLNKDYTNIPLEDIQHINGELEDILSKMKVHESVLKQYRSKDSGIEKEN